MSSDNPSCYPMSVSKATYYTANTHNDTQKVFEFKYKKKKRAAAP